MDFNNFYISGNTNECPLQICYLLIYFTCDVPVNITSLCFTQRLMQQYSNSVWNVMLHFHKIVQVHYLGEVYLYKFSSCLQQCKNYTRSQSNLTKAALLPQCQSQGVFLRISISSKSSPKNSLMKKIALQTRWMPAAVIYITRTRSAVYCAMTTTTVCSLSRHRSDTLEWFHFRDEPVWPAAGRAIPLPALYVIWCS